MNKKDNGELSGRYVALGVIMCMIFSAIVLRLAYLQIVKKEYYREKETAKNSKTISTIAPRGEIYDRNGEVLAANRQGFSIIFTETTTSKEEFFKTISDVFKLLEENNEKLSDNFPLKVNPFRLEVSSKWAELRFKKDRGFDFYKLQELHKGEKFSDLSEEDKEKLDSEVMKISTEEVFKTLVKDYELYNLIKGKYSQDQWESLLKDKEELVELTLKEIDHELIRKYMIVKDTMKMQSFQGHRPVIIANDLKLETAYIFEQLKSDLSGISVLKQPIRDYPHGDLASSILGYIGKIDPEKQEYYELKGYNIYEDYIGKAGIESVYEQQLRGTRGEERIEINKYGRKLKSLGEMLPYPGNNVQLTIDWKIQRAAEMALDDTLASLRELKDKKPSGQPDDVNKQNATRGVAVVLNVNNGEVLALASRPGFDPNLFTVPGRLSKEENSIYFNPNLENFGKDYMVKSGLLDLQSFMGKDISHMNKEEKEIYLLDKIFPKDSNGYRTDAYDVYPKPFYNYATQSLIPPGSTFKIMTGIAGLEEGVITPEETIYDAGPYNKRYKGYAGASWMYNLHRMSHGNQNLLQAIRDSNNYYFYEIADRLFAKGGVSNGMGTKNGLDMIAKYAYKFGLGADPSDKEKFYTGIEIYELFGQVYNYDYGKMHHSISYTRNVYEYLDNGIASIYVGEYKPIDIVPDTTENPKVYDVKKKLTEEIKNQMSSEEKVDMNYIEALINELINIDPKLSARYSQTDVNRILLTINSSINDARTEIKSGVNLYNASIGQGMNVFTPVQLANYVATIANGGNKYDVHLVKKVVSPEGKIIQDRTKETKEPENTGVSKETLESVKEGMGKVTSEDGTASRLNDFPIKSGGKTGSATYNKYQDDLGRASYATFIGFAPYDNPEIAVCVILFDGGHGGYTTDVVRAIYEEYFRERLKVIDSSYKFKYNIEN